MPIESVEWRSLRALDFERAAYHPCLALVGRAGTRLKMIGAMTPAFLRRWLCCRHVEAAEISSSSAAAIYTLPGTS